RFDHTSIVATILRWCDVDPKTAGLGARVAAAPTFEGALAATARSDVPTFTLPNGYAKQGHDCWLESEESDAVGARVVRSLVHQASSVEELKERIQALLVGKG